MFRSIKRHISLLLRQFGKKNQIGNHKFIIRGYFANRFDITGKDEKDVEELIPILLSRSSGAFLDIGVNVGQTLVKVIKHDKDREYYGFEPQTDCCFYAQNFISDNNLRNAKIIQVAISNSNQIVPLYRRGVVDCMASIVDKRQDGLLRAEKLLVQSRIGDDIIQEIGIRLIAVIKIDVEGAEYEVFDGIRETLKRHRPFVLFEVLPNFFGAERQLLPADQRKENQERADRVMRILSDLDYHVRPVEKKHRDVNIKAFDLDNRTGFMGSNFLASPSEHH